MVFKLFRKSPRPAAADECYGAIVAQSRQMRFYAEWDVPDTVTGRFNILSLHMALMLRRLKREPSAKDFLQALVDRFFKDMDQSHRELGVTDLGVPRKVRRLGNLFYGLTQALDEALDQHSTTALEAMLARNVYGGPSAHALQLAAYIEAESAHLDAVPVAVLLGGTPRGAAA
jgi:cytochrome b pre-mRNA-processing protein 3